MSATALMTWVQNFKSKLSIFDENKIGAGITDMVYLFGVLIQSLTTTQAILA